MYQEIDVGNKEVQENSEVAHTEGSLVSMVEPNRIAVVNLNTKVPHTQGSHAPAMKTIRLKLRANKLR